MYRHEITKNGKVIRGTGMPKFWNWPSENTG